ncbi:MAG: hypothetical protein M0Z27_11715 [Thermaerobacter sp.]|nr:hypothetical protein [Thermaerobacter sp.]
MGYGLFLVALGLLIATYLAARRERRRTEALRREVEGAVDEVVLAAEEAVRALEEKRRELAAWQPPPPAREPAAAEVPEPAPAVRPADPLQQRVWELAGQGRNATQIARELGLTPGKVELMVNLQRLRG